MIFFSPGHCLVLCPLLVLNIISSCSVSCFLRLFLPSPLSFHHFMSAVFSFLIVPFPKPIVLVASPAAVAFSPHITPLGFLPFTTCHSSSVFPLPNHISRPGFPFLPLLLLLLFLFLLLFPYSFASTCNVISFFFIFSYVSLLYST